ETKLNRFQTAIAAGVDPVAVVEAINQAHRERDAAKAELANSAHRCLVSHDEMRTVLASLGDAAAALDGAPRSNLAELYTALRLQLRFQPAEHAVDVTIQPDDLRVNSVRVRGGT